MWWSDYGARYLDLQLSRWGQVDPLAEKYYDWNGYHYVMGNPINRIDPDGRDGEATVDKEKHTILVCTVLHISNESLDKLKNFNAGADKTLEDLVMSFYDQYEPTTVSIDGQDYDVSFNLTFEMHDTDADAKSAFRENRENGGTDNLFFANGAEEYKPSSFNNGVLTYSKGAGPSAFAHEVGHGLGLDHNVPTSLAKTNRDKYEYEKYGKIPKIHNGKKVYNSMSGLGGPLMFYRPNRCLSYSEIQAIVRPAVNYPATLSKKSRANLGNIYQFRLTEN